MKAETSYPLKVMQTFDPQTIGKITESSYLYDFGQNASGIIRLKVKGKRETGPDYSCGNLDQPGHAGSEGIGKSLLFRLYP